MTWTEKKNAKSKNNVQIFDAAGITKKGACSLFQTFLLKYATQ